VQLSSVGITATDYGLAARDCTADVDEILPVDPHCMTVVVAESRATHERTAIYDPTLAETQVSRLRAGDYGAVAWIDCSAAARGLLGPDPRLTRSCRHSNKRTRHVYVAMPDQTEPQPSQPAVHSPKPVLLDRGHDIAPFSLSITDTRVIWRQRNPGS
jgi:hypothetical protein